MPTWLIIVLVVVGVFLLVEIGLVLAGKKELAKKLVLPFTLVAGALLAGRALGGGSAAIREENERIKGELAQLKQKHQALGDQLGQATKEHEEKVATLQGKISESDARAATLEGKINTMKAQGAEEWFKNLSPEERKNILKGDLPSGLPDEFRNPPPDRSGNP